jgi:hypothetical protein
LIGGGNNDERRPDVDFILVIRLKNTHTSTTKINKNILNEEKSNKLARFRFKIN